MKMAGWTQMRQVSIMVQNGQLSASQAGQGQGQGGVGSSSSSLFLWALLLFC
jgi:hypothetical protein